MYFEQELNALLKSRYSILYICSNEEARLEYKINYLLNQNNEWSISVWDFVQGYHNNPNDQGKAIRNPMESLEYIERKIILIFTNLIKPF